MREAKKGFTLPGLGKLVLVNRKARTGRNPMTGEAIKIPAKKGDARNLTNSPGAHDRGPAWSPDGAHVAYVSDAGGEYAWRVRGEDHAWTPESVASQRRLR